MPEGDTLRRLADRLHPVAVGRSIDRSVFRHNRWATVDLSGYVIAEIDAAGKHLLMRLDDATTARPPLTIHSHLRMHGSWVRGLPRATPQWRRRVELWLDDGSVLTGVDLPVLDVGSRGSERRWIGHLGPDLCAPAFDAEQATANLSAAGARPLGGALLEQRNLAGIGNLYANEIPFLFGVSPFSDVDSISDLRPFVDVARVLLPVNALLGPQTTTGWTDRRRRHWVHAHRGERCPNCRTPLSVADEADVPWRRVTTWCPGCQVASEPDLNRARHFLRRHRLAMEVWSGRRPNPAAGPRPAAAVTRVSTPHDG